MGSPFIVGAHGRKSTLIPSITPRPPPGPGQVSGTASRFIYWPHKSPQTFSMCFVLAHTLP